ncbi:MAG: cytochrome b/b6 domain-containing protein [Ghiorsea sp.]|nr:cytochrome b/b6 domain-containing protein [Ghiorsea sp.]
MKQAQHILEGVQGYHPITRWLHLGLALGVMVQISLALWMAHPEHQHGEAAQVSPISQHHDTGQHSGANHGASHQVDTLMVMPDPVQAEQPQHSEHQSTALAKDLMQAHRNIGVGVALIVLMHLFWSLKRRGTEQRRQMGVLFSTQQWAEAANIAKSLPMVLIGKKPMVESGNALALTVEMLGLLTMTAMAITGVVIWTLWAGLGSDVSTLAESVMQMHSAIAVVLMLYLAGHVSMALLHVRSGDKVFARIVPCVGKK